MSFLGSKGFNMYGQLVLVRNSFTSWLKTSRHARRRTFVGCCANQGSPARIDIEIGVAKRGPVAEAHLAEAPVREGDIENRRAHDHDVRQSDDARPQEPVQELSAEELRRHPRPMLRVRPGRALPDCVRGPVGLGCAVRAQLVEDTGDQRIELRLTAAREDVHVVRLGRAHRRAGAVLRVAFDNRDLPRAPGARDRGEASRETAAQDDQMIKHGRTAALRRAHGLVTARSPPE